MRLPACGAFPLTACAPFPLQVRLAGFFFLAAFVTYVASTFVRRYAPRLKKAEKRKLNETKDFVGGELRDEQQKLFKTYLDECRSDKQ